MGTVTRLHASAQEVTLGAAVRAYLGTLDHPESKSTRRVYSLILRALAAEYGEDAEVGSLDPDTVAAWVRGRWGKRSPDRWNTVVRALRAAGGYWAKQGWVEPDPAAPLTSQHPRGLFTIRLGERKTPPDRGRALSREQVDELLTSGKYALRDRLLWRMLYETAARSAEILALDVPDLDMPNRCARVRRKGGAMDIIVWQTGTARLLPRYLKGRTSGPLFVTERKARVELPPCDLDDRGRARLTYGQAQDIFKQASGGATLHTLRHSKLTHRAEQGDSTPMLMAISGHVSIRSLAKYARVSAEALRAHQAATDPARRK
jgi:integrase